MLGSSSKRIAVLLFVLLLVPFLYNFGYSLLSQTQVDFPSYYVAAQLAYSRHVSPYDYAAFSDLWSSELSGTPYPYLYPPPSLLVFFPLSLIPYQTAQTLMLALNLALFLALIFLVFVVGRWRWNSPFGIFTIAYAFAYYPVTSGLRNGQINLLVVVLLVLSWYAYRQHKSDLSAALPLALATMLKLYPVVFLIYFLLARRTKIVAWAAGVLVVASTISFAVLPASTWPDWLTKVVPTGAIEASPLGGTVLGAADWENQTVHGFAARLLGEEGFSGVLGFNPAGAKIFAYVLSVLMIGVAGLLFYRSGKKQVPVDLLDDGFAIGLLTMLLIAPVSWIAQLIFVLPAALLAVYRVQQEKSPVVIGIVCLSALVLAWKVPFIATSASFSHGPLLLAVSVYFYAQVCLWLYFAARMWRGLAVVVPAQVSAPSGAAQAPAAPADLEHDGVVPFRSADN